MVALPAVLVFGKVVVNVVRDRRAAAEFALKNCSVPLLVIEVMPLVSALTTFTVPLLEMLPTILVLLPASPSCSVPAFTVVPPE